MIATDARSGAGSLGVLLDIDGVLYVGDEPIPGAIDALRRLRLVCSGLRLVTNTTSRSRRQIVDHLRALGFDATADEVVTPAAAAVEHCRSRGWRRVALLVADALREDLGELQEAGPGARVDAVILGDMGVFTDATLNAAFRMLMDGAELVALAHNRYYRRADGLVLDVGAYAAALEYGTGREGVVVGKPAARFFAAALAGIGVGADRAVMVGDDVEADVGGARDAGLRTILVRTGKYHEDVVAASGIEPTVTVASIADVPALLGGEMRGW
ncbi:MAG TPA: TIGR01458 family HAD-type hydrolase [Baekduia sp.]|nr:TIGR01458 family HAD-type hydrolase [Baekduia sp.]